MAAALHSLRNDPPSNALYSRTIMTDLEFRDNRYPSIPPSRQTQVSSTSTVTPPNRQWDSPSQSASPWSPQNDFLRTQQPDTKPAKRDPGQSPEPHRSSLSYALPATSRRVVERYSLDGSDGPQLAKVSNENKPIDSSTPGRSRPVTPTHQERPTASTSALRNSSVPQPTYPSPISSGTGQYPPIIPLSASPAYNPPVAPNHRAYPQQPTFVMQSNTLNPVQPVYTPVIPQQEEVCVECAMRDQDMADVDVTSPGVWDRASDIAFEELRRKELEDEANGVVVDDATRPRIKGGRLTEQNLKLWLSINPREPTSRQQTLHTYIKSQRSLLEAEALAHARAMQEAKQLDNRMRDTYSQLRRSAYDTGNTSSPADDSGGVRIKPPHSPSGNQTHAKSHSREITLLENGMIVEHVDVRKEEREARERRKREEKRARKSSRSSVMDVTSVISAQSGPLVDNNLKPYSRYSHASSARPTSVLTAPHDRPDLPRAYSQASFSDVHSLGSSSPRRTRFFGMRHLSAGWRSQDSLTPSRMSGSMAEMHSALQREHNAYPLTSSPIDLNTPRRSQIWPPVEGEDPNITYASADEKSKKKKSGLAKIWRIVTGAGKGESHQPDVAQRQEGHDDGPLIPPPPLSYLVERGPMEVQSTGNLRHSSSPSVPSIVSPKFGISSPGMSPPTAPSSLLPSPVSMRPVLEPEIAEPRTVNDGIIEDTEQKAVQDEIVGKSQGTNYKSNQSITSELDLRLQTNSSVPNSPLPSLMVNNARSTSLSREKSLPPLPPGEAPAHILPTDGRPRTLFALPPGTGPAHDFLPPQAPFRTGDVRRQSFGGLSSRPNVSSLTMPMSKSNGIDTRRSFGPRYDEFGLSHQSLGRLEYVEEHPRAVSPIPSTKRKSKFGFASLLGKKHDKREDNSVMQENKHHFPSLGYSPYDPPEDLTSNSYTTSNSRHSALSVPNPNLRMSVTSRKTLEELVQQDADFVAYRYPSNEQRLDLLR